VYGLAGILQKAVGFVMMPIYAHYLRGEGYGIISMIDVVLSILTVIVGYGIASGMQRFYFTKKSQDEKKIFISTAVFLMSLMVIAVSIPALIFNKEIARLAFGKVGLEYFMTIAIFTFIADMTSMSGQQYILIQQRSVFYSVLSLSRFTIGLFLNIYFVVILKMSVLGVLYTNLLTATIFTTFLHAHAFWSTGLHFNKKDAREILVYSLPLIPGYIAMFVRNNADRILVRNYLGLTQLGVYGLVLKFASLIIFFIHEPLNKIWPVKRLEICEEEGGPQMIAKVFTLQLGLMLFGGLFLSLEMPLWIEILTPNEFWVGRTVAFFAVFSKIALSAYYHFIFGLLYEKVTYKISIIQCLGAVMSILLNIVLIKHYGLLGGFVAGLLVYLFQCIVAHYMSKKYYSIPFEWGKVLQMIMMAVALFFLIDMLSVKGIYLDRMLNRTILPFLTDIAKILGLENIKEGKLLLMFSEKFIVIVEAFIKGLLSLSFLAGLFIFNILSKNVVGKVIGVGARRVPAWITGTVK
jgi:O-antigen/teichoic acid export membrane protein